MVLKRRACSILVAAALLADCGGGVSPSTVAPLQRRLAGTLPFISAARGRWKEASIHGFDYVDGAYDTYSGLIFDAAGNLYGTTQRGGESVCDYDESCGIVYELTRAASGTWTETALHAFSQCDSLGFWPRSGLIVDATGNLYGTTDEGGFGCSGVGPGTVFELSAATWSAKVLHRFVPGGHDGTSPQAALTFDASGNLYGTTSEGGRQDNGTVFELSPQSVGEWKETILHEFVSREGSGPQSKLTFDTAGNLYGTTGFGGADRSGCGGYGCGTAFQLKHGTSGVWSLKVLHSFGNANDGADPTSSLTLDSAGNLFGVTSQGGQTRSGCLPYGCGIVFELVSEKTGRWKERIIHEFGSVTDGNLPRGDLVFDKTGALYGTTVLGGLYGAGIAYRMSRQGNEWSETVLHDFGNHRDGALPYTGIILDRAQNLYGTTDDGGRYRVGKCRKSAGCGTVFEIVPAKR